jgi:hypothetical protein
MFQIERYPLTFHKSYNFGDSKRSHISVSVYPEMLIKQVMTSGGRTLAQFILCAFYYYTSALKLHRQHTFYSARLKSYQINNLLRLENRLCSHRQVSRPTYYMEPVRKTTF